MKKIAVLIVFIGSMLTNGQSKNLNNYKYIIVDEKFDFLKTPDQYQTSSLTKFLLQKSNFNVYINKEKLPKDFYDHRCSALTVSVVDESTMFTTKSKIVFKDCYSEVIYTSKLGSSKLKEYKKAYQQSIRKAYNTMSDIKYVYQPKEKETNIIKDTKTEVIKPIVKEVPIKIVTAVKTVVPITESKNSSVNTKEIVTNNVLYAQAIENGFQLVNTKPAVVFQVLKTNVNEVFIIKNKNGVFYKNKDTWVAEYYLEGKLVTEKFTVKF
ncbi:MAG: hypothetical protein AB8B78_01860 [Polaribacter sp.]